jgi:hypothetical protein
MNTVETRKKASFLAYTVMDLAVLTTILGKTIGMEKVPTNADGVVLLHPAAAVFITRQRLMRNEFTD